MDNIPNEIIREIMESSSSDDEDMIFDLFFDSISSSEDSADHQENHGKEQDIHSEEQNIHAEEQDIYAEEPDIHAEEQDIHTEEQDVHAKDQGNKATVKNFMDTVDNYSEADFKSHLSVKRSTVENLLLTYSQSGFSPNWRRGLSEIGSRKEMYMFMWYISTPISFQQLGNMFGVSHSSSKIAVQRVCSWLVTDCKQYIKWPQGDDVVENCRKYEAVKKIPGVIGTIDCTHINIYKKCFKRKKSFSINLQAVVDADKKFIDIFCGVPGSLNATEVFLKSPLYRKANADCVHLFPFNTFILGDSTYPATSWLVPPFKDKLRLTEQQRSFNHLHSSTRENAFGLLKGRFRRLLNFKEQNDIELVKHIVVSACVLHNFCISVNDEYSEITGEDNLEVQSNSIDSVVDYSVKRRQILFNDLIQRRFI